MVPPSWSALRPGAGAGDTDGGMGLEECLVSSEPITEHKESEGDREGERGKNKQREVSE